MAKRNKPDAPPKYEHQEFPKILYGIEEGTNKVIRQTVKTPDAFKAAIEEGWAESPADLPDVDEVADTPENRLRAENAALKAQMEELLAAQAAKTPKKPKDPA